MYQKSMTGRDFLVFQLCACLAHTPGCALPEELPLTHLCVPNMGRSIEGRDSHWLESPMSTLLTGAVAYWTPHVSSVLLKPGVHISLIPHSNNYVKKKKKLCLSPMFTGCRSLEKQYQSKWRTPQIQGWKEEWEKEKLSLSFVFS